VPNVQGDSLLNIGNTAIITNINGDWKCGVVLGTDPGACLQESRHMQVAVVGARFAEIFGDMALRVCVPARKETRFSVFYIAILSTSTEVSTHKVRLLSANYWVTYSY
jgi:hypothetical protein